MRMPASTTIIRMSHTRSVNKEGRVRAKMPCFPQSFAPRFAFVGEVHGQYGRGELCPSGTGLLWFAPFFGDA
jgi:hypothetical protein